MTEINLEPNYEALFNQFEQSALLKASTILADFPDDLSDQGRVAVLRAVEELLVFLNVCAQCTVSLGHIQRFRDLMYKCLEDISQKAKAVENAVEEACECGESVSQNDPYFASPCGTFCEDCMREHLQGCGVCRKEFQSTDEPHLKVGIGHCNTCGHYGVDCTGVEDRCCRCNQKIGDAEYLMDEDNCPRHYCCPPPETRSCRECNATLQHVRDSVYQCVRDACRMYGRQQ